MKPSFSNGAPEARPRGVGRAIALVAIVAAFVVGSKLLIENVLGFDLESRARSWLAAAGPAGAATVIGLLAADVFIPVPSSVVMILSGAAFGVWWGALIAGVGSIAGEWLGFELARRYGSAWASRFVGDEREVARLNAMIAKHGAAAVAITRPLPVVMETMSLVAGVSTMRRATFLLASVVGAASVETGSLIPAIVILLAVGGAGLIWYRATRAGLSSSTSRD